MDFFEQANSHVRELNGSEKKIFEYVVRNASSVGGMRIRELANACYVSTTTIMRFARKLGFAGYREFSESLRFSTQRHAVSKLPSVLRESSYGEEYLKNIIESVRVLTEGKVRQFGRAVAEAPTLYCYGTGLDREVAGYAHHLFTALGYRAVFLNRSFEAQAAMGRLQPKDMALLVSMSGEQPEVVSFAERLKAMPGGVVAGLTHSANNTLQSLSSIDLYVFADHILYEGFDLTSRTAMFVIVELLAHHLMAQRQ